MKVAIVILNYNGEKLLTRFLPDVIQYSPSYAEVIIADNASTDNSVEYVQKHFPSVKTIQLQSNAGFAGGYNNALKLIDAEYYVLLNSDIQVTKNWIEPVIDFLDNHPAVAASQPKIKSYQDKHLFEHAGAAGGFIDYLGYPFCRGRIFDMLEEDNNQYNNAIEIFWATGACMFIRSNVFHTMNGFDDAFFAHMEEIDLCWRIKRSGHSIYCIPSSTVYHIGGGTLPKANPKKTYLNFRNNLMMLHKNLDAKNLKSVLRFRLFLDAVAALKFILTGNWGDCAAVCKAYLYVLKHKSAMNKRRNEFKATTEYISCIYKRSIVKAFYLSGTKKFSQLPTDKFA